MKIYTNMLQMTYNAVDDEIRSEIGSIIEKNDIKVSDNFIDTLGGAVKIVETLDDILEIKDFDGTSIAVSPIEFDIAYYLPSRHWILLFIATNNAGGDVFFIPDEIFHQVPNIVTSVIEHKSVRGELKFVKRVSPISGEIIERGIPLVSQLTDAEHMYITMGIDA